jgi:hypothetical protein
MLRPITTRTRQTLDLSGIWQCQLDPDAVGDSQGSGTRPCPTAKHAPGVFP